jgi:hypothetical protein
MGRILLEICALSAMLAPGTEHLEHALLQPADVDPMEVESGRDSLSLRGVSM